MPEPVQFLPAGYGQLRVVMRAIGSAKDSIVTFGYKPIGSEDPADHAAVFDAALRATGAPFVPANYSNQWAYKGTYCTYMTESGPLVGTFPVTVVGTGIATPLPLNCAVILRKNTALGGRHGRGRCFLPPLNVLEASIDSLGTIPNADVTALSTKWGVFQTQVEASSYTLRLIHSYRPDLGETGIIPTTILSLGVDSIIGTQRRRLR